MHCHIWRNMFLTRQWALLWTGATRHVLVTTTPVASCRHVHFEVTPIVSRMDDPITIQVGDLGPKQPVTLAAMLEEEEDVFVSCAHYLTDDSGWLDLTTSNAMGGTFTGIEPMGLFWSLHPPQITPRPAVRLKKKDVTQPHRITLSVLAGHIDAEKISLHANADALAKIELHRYYALPGVLRVPVRHGKVRGTLFIPQHGQGKHPALIDLYGSPGGLLEHRAAMLASRGFVTLALAYFGYQDLPKKPRVDCDYFLEAIDFLVGHDNVGYKKLGIIGTSMGGSIALTLAPLDTRIRAVAIVGSVGFRFLYPHEYQGKQMSFKTANRDELKEVDGAMSTQDMIYNIQASDCSIPVEEASHTDFLFLHGTSDQCIDPRLMLRIASRLLDHGHEGVSVHMYQGAGHVIDPPYLPFFYTMWHKVYGVKLVLGGECRGHARAQADAWDETLCFFRDRIR